MTAPTPAEPYIERARRDSVRGALWTFVATALGSPLGLAANIVLARALGSSGLGKFGTYAAIYGLALVVTDLGWREATVQWMAAAGARENEEERHSLIRACSGFQVFAAGPACAGVAFILLLANGWAVGLVGASAAWATQALTTSQVINTATTQNVLAAQIALTAGLAGRVALVLTALASQQPGLTWLIQVVFLLAAPVIATWKLSTGDRQAVFRPRLQLRAPRGFWRYGLSAALSALLGTVVYGGSEILVLRSDNLVAAAGVFTVVSSLAGQMTSVLDSVQGPLAPTAAGLIAIDRDRALQLLDRSLRLMSALGAVASCVLTPVGVVAIDLLYGKSFVEGTGPFVLLALISSLQTAMGPLWAFGFATRSASQIVIINLVALAADAAASILLIPSLSLWGAALAGAAAQLFSLMMIARLVTWKLELRLRDVLARMNLFMLALTVGAAEGSLVATFERSALLAAAVSVVVGLVAIRIALQIVPSLRLEHHHIKTIGEASASSLVHRISRLVIWSGLVSSEPSEESA